MALAENRDWEYLPAGISSKNQHTTGEGLIDDVSEEVLKTPAEAPPADDAHESFDWSEFEEAFKGEANECSTAAWEDQLNTPWHHEQASTMCQQSLVPQSRAQKPAQSFPSIPGGDGSPYAIPATSDAQQQASCDPDTGVQPAHLMQAYPACLNSGPPQQLGPNNHRPQQMKPTMPASCLQSSSLGPPAVCLPAVDKGGEEDVDNDLESLMALCCS